MGAPTLVSIAQRAAVKHVDDIQGFADTPLHLIRPILAKVRSPEQLQKMEADSPHIIGPDTVRLWKDFISRDIANGDRNELEPKNPGSWWKVYRKLKRQDEEKQAIAKQILRESLGEHEAARQSKQTTFLPVVLPPQRGERVRLDHGVKIKKIGQNAMAALLKNDRGRSVPTTAPTPVRGGVTQAPTQMVNQYLRSKDMVPLPVPNENTPVRKVRVPYNPFTRAKKVKPTLDLQALALALRAEESKRVNSQRRLPTGTAAAKQPPEPAVKTLQRSAQAAKMSKSAETSRTGTTRTSTVNASLPSKQARATAVDRSSPTDKAVSKITGSSSKAVMTSAAPITTERKEPLQVYSPSKQEARSATLPESSLQSAAPPNPTTRVVKRKAPNIFMPTKKVKR